MFIYYNNFVNLLNLCYKLTIRYTRLGKTKAKTTLTSLDCQNSHQADTWSIHSHATINLKIAKSFQLDFLVQHWSKSCQPTLQKYSEIDKYMGSFCNKTLLKMLNIFIDHNKQQNLLYNIILLNKCFTYVEISVHM